MEYEVVIIGAGWAGLTAAYHLAKKGIKPLIIEASPNAGGRARAINFNNYTLDNGQHLLIGAYKNILNILNELNVPFNKHFHKTNLFITTSSNNNKFSFNLPNIFYPFNLLIGIFTVKGCTFIEKLKLLWFCTKLKVSNFNLSKDITIDKFLKQNKQSNNLIKHFWEPIALAAMSTPINLASAKLFLNVLKDTFTPPSTNSNLLFTKVDLSTLFPKPIIEFLKTNSQFTFNTRVKNIEFINKNAQSNQFIICTNKSTITAKNIILATPIKTTSMLLKNIPQTNTLQNNLNLFTYENIITIYFEFANNIKQEIPMFGLVDSLGQWFFNRTHANQPNILSVIITSKNIPSHCSKEEFANNIFLEVKSKIPNLQPYKDYKIINEKQAAFSAVVDVDDIRPLNKTNTKGLYLAGDYTKTGYPACLEGAVSSGIECAKEYLKDLN